MSFSLRIDQPAHVENFEFDGDQVFICRVGADLTAHKLYFAVVGLDPFPEDAPEYWFGIIERDACTGKDEVVLSGLRLVRIFSQDDKLAILGVICGMTELLLKQVRPKKVHRMTRDAYQNGRGIEKHDVVSRVFADCGYRVTKCDSWHGQRTWLCELVEQNPIAVDEAH